MTKPVITGLPADFVWGVSTSSYQIEGAVKDDGRGPSIWDKYCRLQGKIGDGSNGDIACDHYHRWAEDVAILRELGIPAYRFSVAWPRVLPQGRGPVNQAGLDFYDRLIDGLLEAGIEPWLCLYHWDLPQALEDFGGWTSRDTPLWFADYTALVARRYGDRVSRFATFNEPNVFTLFGYSFEWAAPGIASKTAHLKAIHHVNLAHGDAVAVLRGLVPTAAVGAIHNCQPVRPATAAPEDGAAVGLFDEHWNLAFADPQLLGHYPPRIAEAVEPHVRPGDLARICRRIDWFGLNHYAPIWAKGDAGRMWGFAFGGPPEGTPYDDPGAFRDQLLSLTRRYRLPIYVTENGKGTFDKPGEESLLNDQERIAFHRDYIEAMAEAARAGADVRGYFAWSLLDCFEWGSGYAIRFGLVAVDPETRDRTVKASGRWYGEVVRG